MNRIFLGAVSALLLVFAGVFWWQGRAAVERGAPPPESSSPHEDVSTDLPEADPHGKGAALPFARKKVVSKEEQRFNRYDRNRDGLINRNEMLSTRVKAFQKLDSNHDNLLSFEEWAVKTSNRFKQVDANGDGQISRTELKAYDTAQDARKAERVQRKAAACSCAKVAGRGGSSHSPESDDDD